MNAVIELHDSQLICIESNGGDGIVLMDAYVHRGEGDPLHSPHQGGMQRIRMTFEGMMTQGPFGNLPADIWEGALLAGSDVQENILRCPAFYTEPVRLSMMLSEDARLVIVSGSGLSIEPEGEFRFVEMVDLCS